MLLTCSLQLDKFKQRTEENITDVLLAESGGRGVHEADEGCQGHGGEDGVEHGRHTDNVRGWAVLGCAGLCCAVLGGAWLGFDGLALSGGCLTLSGLVE